MYFSSRLSFIANPPPLTAARWVRISAATGISISLHLVVILGLYSTAKLVFAPVARDDISYSSTHAFTAELASSDRKKNVQSIDAAILLPAMQNGPIENSANIISIASNLKPSKIETLVASTIRPATVNSPPIDRENAAQASDISVNKLPPAVDYRFTVGLDPPPRPLKEIEPEYPKEGNLQVGTVVLRLLINEQGIPDDVAVVRASPKGVFENAAITAFRAAKFSPGKFLGLAVKSQMTIEVEFTPINRGGVVSGRGY